MKYLIYLAVIIVLFGLNVGMFSHLRFFGGVPNLLMLLVITLALEKENRDYMFVALVSGLFLDFYSSVFVGSFLLAFVALGIIIQAITNKFLVIELNWRYLLVLLVASYIFVYGFVALYNYVAFYAEWSKVGVDFYTLRNRALPELAYNLLFLYPIYIFGNLLGEFIDRLNRRLYT